MCGELSESEEELSAEQEAHLGRIVDCHAHPHDTKHFDAEQDGVDKLVCAKMVCMSSNLHNQELTARLASRHPEKIVPAFGLHPWFTHAIAIEPFADKLDHYTRLWPGTDDERHPELTEELMRNLPEPLMLDEWIRSLRGYLDRYPTAMVGEVGLDRSARVPCFGGHIAPVSLPPTREWPTGLTKLRTPIEHQKTILLAQLDIAIIYRRNVSMHSVAAQGATQDVLADLKKKHKTHHDDIAIDLHSYGGSKESATQIQKAYKNVWFSFSSTVNARSDKTEETIAAVARDRLLIESDWASARGSDKKLHEALLMLRSAHDLHADAAIEGLEQSWQLFLDGNEETGERSGQLITFDDFSRNEHSVHSDLNRQYEELRSRTKLTLLSWTTELDKVQSTAQHEKAASEEGTSHLENDGDLASSRLKVNVGPSGQQLYQDGLSSSPLVLRMYISRVESVDVMLTR
ncbi:uncharacterized protein L969DRAFT_624969 [Mixia osmundae IAM 14324]|uniref:TatD DNase family Scn1 n=1 Tax=Mixia osmundae (strain CBS 9802 / IAM 14324 / JCM 22182 / KY 12970) TaxID=764103 RepID=G7E768_MIXOS|nr:uncharacterized protein L969DRAFT_624969 [Mixia osmundae IAM 14324]KEI38937.1 hypothetical protein L969DRAFT_624969 [Mixia osmundae IAM 14324]GAA98678.1 hypothetical protein E5Q_05366 [Mixia osmundae IAM 14324]